MYAPVLRCYAVVAQSVERQPSKLDERVRFLSIAPRGRFIPMPEDSAILGTQTGVLRQAYVRSQRNVSEHPRDTVG